jgi:malonyl-CoA O-methyltransferase
MNLHQRSVCGRFDAAAATYEAGATIQERVAERLLNLLPPPESVRRILEVGCGTGLLTRRLAVRYPDAVLDALDHSIRMIDVARRWPGRVAWHVGDIMRFETDARFDLAASNCALHWIQPLGAVFATLSTLLAPDGRLVFSIMLDGTLGELHESRLRAVPSKPPLGRLPTLVEVRHAVAAAGCRIEHCREEVIHEEYPSAAALLRHIHDLGLTGGTFSRAVTPLNRLELERLTSDYDRHHRTGTGSVIASYIVGYLDGRRQS